MKIFDKNGKEVVSKSVENAFRAKLKKICSGTGKVPALKTIANNGYTVVRYGGELTKWVSPVGDTHFVFNELLIASDDAIEDKLKRNGYE